MASHEHDAAVVKHDGPKHTPGPWQYSRTHVRSPDAWYVICDAMGRGPILDVGGKDINSQIGEAKHLITDPGVIEANARLIAAAPTMLDQLIEARAAIASLDVMALGGQHANHPEEQEWYFRDELLSRIDAAIAKATDSTLTDAHASKEGTVS